MNANLKDSEYLVALDFNELNKRSLSFAKFIEDNFSWGKMAKGFLKIVQENIDKK